MIASDSAKKRTYERMMAEKKARHELLIERLWERSESPNDMWAEMAREAEQKG